MQKIVIRKVREKQGIVRTMPWNMSPDFTNIDSFFNTITIEGAITFINFMLTWIQLKIVFVITSATRSVET